jgi:hypothetical protein
LLFKQSNNNSTVSTNGSYSTANNSSKAVVNGPSANLLLSSPTQPNGSNFSSRVRRSISATRGNSPTVTNNKNEGFNLTAQGHGNEKYYSGRGGIL